MWWIVSDNPPHLKYVTAVPCNLSLITTFVGECRSFSDINVPQGSVATHMRCDGIFSKWFAANLLGKSDSEKKFENRLRINRLAGALRMKKNLNGLLHLSPDRKRVHERGTEGTKR